MGEVTIPSSNKSFFTDRTNKKYRGNNNTAFTTPKVRAEIYDLFKENHIDFSRSVSAEQGRAEDWSLVQDELKTKFNIDVPHINDYVPEIDDKFTWKRPFANFGFDGVGGDMTPRADHKSKIKYLNGVIQEKLQNLPEGAKKDFKGYDHYFSLRKEKLKQQSIEMGLTGEYADSTFDYYAGSFGGTAVGAFHDPLVLATLPFSFLYGWQGSILYASLRAAAIESVIGAGSQALIETQVVPYRQELGQEYTWKDAAKTIGLVGVTAGVTAGAFTGGAKGSVALYKHAQLGLAKVNPEIRNKLIGKEFEKLVNKGADPELLFDYLNKQIAKLEPKELLTVYNALPNNIKTHINYANAAKSLEEKILDDADNPLENTKAGNTEHNDRYNNSLANVLRNEDPSIPEQPTAAIIIDEKRPIMNHQKINPENLDADAKTFQFKTGGDSKGVLEKLQGVEKWDDVAAGTVMVWERADGKMFIADGHQRLGLAKRLKAKGQDIELNAQVRREVDGWTPQDVMVEAMVVNIVAGTARADDVARIFLQLGENAAAIRIAGKIKQSQALYQTATGLHKLGDEGFNYWLNSNIKDGIAAQVGDIVDDPAASINILKILEAAKPKDTIEARMMIRQALAAGMVTSEQIDLFGKTIMKQSLFVERTKVYTAALRDLKKEKSVFRALVDNDEQIIKEGRNKLDTKYNVEKAEHNAIAIQKIEKLANRKGELSDELTAAAKLWKDGSKRKAVTAFKAAIKRSVERGDHKGIDASGNERTTFFAKAEAPSRQKPKQEIVEQKLEDFSDPKSQKFLDDADDQLDEVKLEVRSDEASGAVKTSDTVKDPSGTKTQDEFFQATTAEPPSTVLAKAKATPSASRTLDANSIGEIKVISGTNHKVLQISNVDKLYKLANKHISNIEASINNIAIKFKNAKVITNIKDKKTLRAKIKKRQAIYGKKYNEQFLGDIARGRLILDDVNEVVDGLVVEGWLRKNFKIIQKKDYFVTPKEETGYRATHYQLVTEDGLAFELQVHNRQLVEIYDNLRKNPNSSYNKYKDVGRKLTPEEEADRLQLAAKEKELIDEAAIVPDMRTAMGRNELKLTDKIADEIIDDVLQTKTLKQVINDIDEDAKIIDFLKDCPGIK
tara:strand:- start:3008 stop:6388 length:3381 start_codon:yes stop_codon:yes gene_type:complete